MSGMQSRCLATYHLLPKGISPDESISKENNSKGAPLQFCLKITISFPAGYTSQTNCTLMYSPLSRA